MHSKITMIELFTKPALAKNGSLNSAAVEAVEMDMEEEDAVMEATQHELFEDNFDHASV